MYMYSLLSLSICLNLSIYPHPHPLSQTGLTPLMEAASGGYYEVGKVLINKVREEKID